MEDEIVIVGASKKEYRFDLRPMRQLRMLVDPQKMWHLLVLVTDSDRTPAYVTYAEENPKEALLRVSMHLKYSNGYFATRHVRDHEGEESAQDIRSVIRRS